MIDSSLTRHCSDSSHWSGPSASHCLTPATDCSLSLSGLGRSRSLRSRVLPRSRSEDSGPGNTGQTGDSPGSLRYFDRQETRTLHPWGPPTQEMRSTRPLSSSDLLTLLTFLHWCIILNHFSQFTLQRGGYYQSYQFVITRLSAEII